jgi:NAD(P)-dependent dehydrogenase (short-subunit alcohol dehydrogenase family)
MGLKVCLADLSPQALEPAVAEVAAASRHGRDAAIAVPTDVSKQDDVRALCDAVYHTFGEVAVLMNNAGTAPGGGPWDAIDRWRWR